MRLAAVKKWHPRKENRFEKTDSDLDARSLQDLQIL